MANLVLTGFMGTGKTTVGKKTAKELGIVFVDTDRDIEKVTGMTVKEIFDKYGEVRFRSEEKAAVRRVSQADNQVIATGGGVVLDLENIDLLRTNGVVICLTATPELIFERVRLKKTRPLLEAEDLVATIKVLLKEREEFYRVADATVDTVGKSLEEVRDAVIKTFREHINKNR